MLATKEKPHPGFQLPTAALHPGFGFAISNTATEFDAVLYDFRGGSLSSGYFRDAETGLDYAKNRYHQPGMGRFLTADASGANWDLSDPASWNAYAYTEGDPVNFIDPDGFAQTCGDTAYLYNGQLQGTIGSVLGQGGDVALLAETEYTESAHGAGSSQQEMFAVGDVIMNRWQIVNGYYTALIPIAVIPGWGQADGTISSIINAPKQFDVWSGGVLSATAQSNLNFALNSAATSSACGDLVAAITTSEGLWGERNDHALYETAGDLQGNNQLVVTSFNSYGSPSNPRYETAIGSFGTSRNIFYGTPASDFQNNGGQSIPSTPRKPRTGPKPPRRRITP
jgi:RHS repeat-associated protein